jgi:predicted unusual protein kinase regulating ubiquinone biosynthesis (AarF/ABC1/UbiB family)
LDEFARTLYEELDYLAEARNAETFAENFALDPYVYIPAPYWTHTTGRVLTLEDVTSIKITDLAAMERAGIERTEVASRLFHTYLQQVFYDGFFHADPHPGNLFVHPAEQFHVGAQEEVAGRPFYLIFVDFGMVGRITPRVKQQLRELAIGLGTRDAGAIVRAYERLGFLLPGADLELIERATSRVFDRFWGISMGELSHLDYDAFRDFVQEFRDLLFDMPFQIPKDFIYLGRTLGILSGLATQLDPDFNVFAETEPFARRLVSEEMQGGWNRIREQLEQWGRLLLGLPNQLDLVLNKTVQGDLRFRTSPDREWRQAVNQLDSSINRLLWVVGGSALLLSGVISGVNGETEVAFLFYGGAGLSLLRVLWFRRWWDL